MIVQNTLSVLALELLTSCQAIDIRRRLNTHGQGITPLHQAIYDHVREKVDFFEIDREIWPDIAQVERMVRSGELLGHRAAVYARLRVSRTGTVSQRPGGRGSSRPPGPFFREEREL